MELKPKSLVSYEVITKKTIGVTFHLIYYQRQAASFPNNTIIDELLVLNNC